MPSQLAPVTPDVLKWARESINVSVAEAAKRAKVPNQRLEDWERGEGMPTVAKLRDLADLYRRPLAVFFLPEPPAGYSTIRDFRRLPDLAEHAWSRALHKVYRRAVDQQETMVELAEDDLAPQVPTAEVTDDPEIVAGRLRSALGISIEEQFSWRKPEDALKGWIEAVEDLGVLVLRTSDLDLEEMRGFSLPHDEAPVVVVNALDFPRGQAFTLLHELAHLALRTAGLCDTYEPDGAADKRVETFCNAVAAAIAMPKEEFLKESLVAPTGARSWDQADLVVLSTRWSVSTEAILRRLVTFGRATPAFYGAKRSEYLAFYRKHREEERAKRKAAKKNGGPPPHRMAIRDRGAPYVRTVLDAYHRDAISLSSTSWALGLKVRHIPATERAIRR